MQNRAQCAAVRLRRPAPKPPFQFLRSGPSSIAQQNHVYVFTVAPAGGRFNNMMPPNIRES